METVQSKDVGALIRAVGGSAVVFGQSSGAVLSLRAAEAGLPIPRLSVYEPPFVLNDARERGSVRLTEPRSASRRHPVVPGDVPPAGRLEDYGQWIDGFQEANVPLGFES